MVGEAQDDRAAKEGDLMTTAASPHIPALGPDADGAVSRVDERVTPMAPTEATVIGNLRKQGFVDVGDGELARYSRPLRFTPAVGSILVAIGAVARSPVWLTVMSLVALSGVLFPNGMVLDGVYNIGVRRLFAAPRLPSTPAPRRFSYLLSATLLAGSAMSFYMGLDVLGFLLAGLVVVGGAILALTLWCTGSWIYRMVRALRSGTRLP
jgi:hypothetical protein